MFKVMSIGGCCADLAFLGPGVRVPGPVDNWWAIGGLKAIVGLFTNFREQLENGWESTKNKPVGYKGDIPLQYEYKDYSCRHLNMEDSEVVKKVIGRYEKFLEFWRLVKEDKNCYFSYVFNECDVQKKGNKMVLSDSTRKMLDEISQFFPLSKLILVGTRLVKLKMGSGFKHYIDEVPKGINYVEIKDVRYLYKNNKDKRSAWEQFNSYMKKTKNGSKCPDPVKKKQKIEWDDWDD